MGSSANLLRRLVSWAMGVFGYRRYRLRDTRDQSCLLCCGVSRTVMRRLPPCAECGGTVLVVKEVSYEEERS